MDGETNGSQEATQGAQDASQQQGQEQQETQQGQSQVGGDATDAYYVFLGVVFRGSSVRRSTARRCAPARRIGAGGPHGRARTCGPLS